MSLQYNNIGRFMLIPYSASRDIFAANSLCITNLQTFIIRYSLSSCNISLFCVGASGKPLSRKYHPYFCTNCRLKASITYSRNVRFEVYLRVMFKSRVIYNKTCFTLSLFLKLPPKIMSHAYGYWLFNFLDWLSNTHVIL